jgi:hypothetical protein
MGIAAMERTHAYRILVRKLLGKPSLGRLRNNAIKMDL